MRPVLLDRFQHRKRKVRVYLGSVANSPLLTCPTDGELLGVCRWHSPNDVEIVLNADQSLRSLERTYVHELCHLVTDRLGMAVHRDELVAECVEELSPILRRYALKLPWDRIRRAQLRLLEK